MVRASDVQSKLAMVTIALRYLRWPGSKFDSKFDFVGYLVLFLAFLHSIKSYNGIYVRIHAYIHHMKPEASERGKKPTNFTFFTKKNSTTAPPTSAHQKLINFIAEI